MTDNDKLKKLKKLADAMYYAAQYLTTDASKLNKAMNEYHQFIVYEYHKEEPVSEDLKEAAQKYADLRMSNYGIAFYAFMSGAKWQKEQFEKERLKHCDELTNEQAQIESDFVTQHLKENNCTPTFINAVEYGMRLKEKEMQSTIELAEDHAMLAGMEKMKEEMMTKSIEAVVSQVPCSNEIILYNPSSVNRYYLPQEMNKLGLNKGDKVKIIIIKKD